MPFVRKGKTVYNQETGKSKGTSTSVAKAKAHMRALYANVPEAREAAMKKYKPRFNDHDADDGY